MPELCYNLPTLSDGRILLLQNEKLNSVLSHISTKGTKGQQSIPVTLLGQLQNSLEYLLGGAEECQDYCQTHPSSQVLINVEFLRKLIHPYQQSVPKEQSQLGQGCTGCSLELRHRRMRV